MPKNNEINTEFESGSTFIPSNKQKTDVQNFLEEIRNIFRSSPLLKGNIPPDKLVLEHLSPVMSQNLKELKKVDSEIVKKAAKAIEEERNGIRKPGKGKK